MSARLRSLAFSAFLCLSLLVFIPVAVHAAFGSGNLMCIGIDCPCKMGPKKSKCDGPGPGVVGCFCQEEANGKMTTGECVAPMKCEATGTSEGKSPMDPSKLMEALKALMDALKGKGGGGGDKDQKPPEQFKPEDQYPACVKNEATGTTSPIPCKNPDGSINYGDGRSFGAGGLGGGSEGSSLADMLLKALGGSVSSKLSEKDSEKSEEETAGDEGSADDSFDEITDEEGGIGDELINLPENSGDGGGSEGGDGSGGKSGVSKGDFGSLKSSLVGDIYVGDLGATIFARSRDPGSNTEVAGFYGGGAFSAQASQSLVGRMCASRPWAGGLLSAVIPPSFFDGLCRRAGYQVGVPKISPPSIPIKKASPAKKAAPKTKAAPGPTIHPEVDIWAEPPAVRLGTRTYIFWTSKDVISCEATGPSFYQKSLSGGASTVPLSDPTTFRIICLTVASTTVEDSVTVNLAL